MLNSQNITVEQVPYKQSAQMLNLAISENNDDFDSFYLLESAIDGIYHLHPDKKALRQVFLEEDFKKQQRQQLTKTLQWWTEILEGSEDIDGMVAACKEHSDEAAKSLKTNLKAAIKETEQLERSYRSVALFFRNTNNSQVSNVSFLNVSPEQLRDLDNTHFIDYTQEILQNNFDRLDLRNNYSLLILPGYLGSNKVVEKWAKISYDNKVMLITDFEHLGSPDDVMELFDAAFLTGDEPYRSNMIMTCNWLVGRGRFDKLGEEEHLYLPPSMALGGKIYSTLMSQVTAGKKYGNLKEVSGTAFDLKKSETASLEKLGLVPMVKENGKIMAYSAKTLFNGDNVGLQTYSVVRVFDYVAKVMMDFLNRRAFENFNANTRKDLNGQILRFLDSITGPTKLIENFTIKRFEQDPVQKDRVYLDLHLKPYFPAKTFLIKLEGHKNDNSEGNEWASQYQQENSIRQVN